MKTQFLLLLLSPLFVAIASAQVGSLDPAFGNNGIQLFHPDPMVNPAVMQVIPAADKSYFVIYNSVDNNQVTVGRFFSSGALDLTYGNGGYSEPIPINFVDAALQDDGKLVLAGTTMAAFYADIHDDQMVVRLDTDGFLDQSFDDDGIFYTTYTDFSYEFVTSIIIDNGLIVVGGYSVSIVGQFGIYHYDALDYSGATVARVLLGNLITDLPNFSPSYYQYSFAVQGDKVLVTAVTTDLNTGIQTTSLLRFLSSGTPDVGFGQDGAQLLDNNFFYGNLNVWAHGVKTIITSYHYDPVSDKYGFAVTRFDSNGQPDNSFNGNGRQVTDFGSSTPVTPTALAVQGGKLIVGGHMVNPATQKLGFVLARYNPDGSLDHSFDGDGKQMTFLDGYHLSLEKMAVLGSRLAVTGMATTNLSQPREFRAVTAWYILEGGPAGNFTCPGDTVVETEVGVCSAVVNGIDPVGVYNTLAYTLSGATTGTGTGSVSGTRFNKGTTTVAYTPDGNLASSCSFTVTVEDKEAPVLSDVSASDYFIWPPNHKMYEINLKYEGTDNCGWTNTLITVKSNEQDQGGGIDDIPDDWKVISDHHVWLRAEYLNPGKGRVYNVTITLTDAAGNTTSKTMEIRVGKNPNTSFTNLNREPGVEKTGLSVKVLSNPSANNFTLMTGSNNAKKISLRVVNTLGAVVESRTGIPAKGQVQLGSAYPNGLYFAEIKQGEETVIVKLVKQQ